MNIKSGRNDGILLKFLRNFETFIITILMVMMILILLFSTIDLGFLIGKEVLSPPMFIISVTRLQEMFGLVMLILIGIEILEAIKAYLVHQEMHVEVVLMVAIIALAHKVIILDFKLLPSYTLLGIGIIIVSLSTSYYLIKKVRLEKKKLYRDDDVVDT